MSRKNHSAYSLLEQVKEEIVEAAVANPGPVKKQLL